jgi:hypothetical protein
MSLRTFVTQISCFFKPFKNPEDGVYLDGATQTEKT